MQPMLAGVAEKTVQAKALFAPLAPTYDRYATLLSYGQDPRWRRFLVSRIDAGRGERVLDVATGTGMVARELIRRKGCTVVGRRPERPDARRGAAPARRRCRARRGERREPPVRRRRVRRASPSPTCSATSTTRRRCSPSWHASSGRAGRSPASSSASLKVRGEASGSCTSAPPCRPPAPSPAAAGARWARSSAPRSGPITKPGRSSVSSARGATPGSKTSRLAACPWEVGSSRGDGRSKARVLRPPERRLARLCDRPPPAVHGLEPGLRRAGRGTRARLPHGPHGLDDGRVRAGTRCRGAHARRAERPAAPDEDPIGRADHGLRRRTRGLPARSASGPRPPGAGGSSPSSPSARSSSPPTTSNGSAARSTTPGGSRSPGPRSRS